MSSLSSRSEQAYNMGGRKGYSDTRWSDIDKARLYGIGTVMYSALTVVLHPLTVMKIRRQVLGNSQSPTNTSITSSRNIGQYYRGLGVVVSLAIPGRIIYISTLEYSRELADTNARQLLLNPPSALASFNKELLGLLPLVTPFSGGVAGGLAAVSSQLIVVPMDVISQKLMVMEDSVFKEKGSAVKVARSIINTDGWRGLYKGFGLSLFTSLPAGSIWWATYAGCKDQLSVYGDPNICCMDGAIDSVPLVARQGIIQVASAFCAAVAASVTTQPLDTIKTRLQVGNTQDMKQNVSLFSVAKELTSTPGLYKGMLPRIAHMGIWGSVLSAAY
eukprot:CAMPEP_0181089852 /NCGR_PEP_ID=MMETSP1071-20121207/7522_1 /TAXON_ID=35127 /ORGANISM="Thalassiosira sp., Strain NH16" /LENGTH=330 /DNA_ID=CAMNT_0023171825 /DNA_START=24 /DNA_END=1013 /DNA_ORIENTATION=+